MTPIRFTIPGNPVPKARARAGNGHHYTPESTRAHEQRVKVCAKQARVPRLLGPVKLTCWFYRENAHACDVDNLAKLVQDALNGIAWNDDRQIVWLTSVKQVDRNNPRTEVVIEEAA